MRKVISVILILSVGAAVGGTYLLASPQTVTSGNCSAQDLVTVKQNITKQTQLLSEQDFGQAMTYSSDTFNSSISESQFARIISSGYEFLLQNPKIIFKSCNESSEGQIVILATFTTESDVVELSYSMVNERDSWFIDSASRPGNDQLAV